MLRKMLFVLAGVALLAGGVGAQTYKGGGGGGGSAKPGMALPDTAFVAVGRQMNLYYSMLSPISQTVGGSLPWFFDVFGTAGAGTQRDRWWQYAPGSDADITATIKAYDYAGKAVETKSMTVAAVSNTAGSGVKNVLFMGDSMLESGTIIGQVDSLFSVSGGGNILPIGNLVDAGYYNAAYGGKTFEWFATAGDGTANPLWTGGRLDFQSYVAGLPFGSDIDYCVIHLGGNDAFVPTAGAAELSSADVDEIIGFATAIVDTLFNATYGYPSARALFVLMPTASAYRSAFGDDYPSGNYNMVAYQKNLAKIRAALIAAFDGGRYSNRVDVCHAGLWVDNLLGYGTTSAANPTVRITDASQTLGTNFLHPDADGMYQMADAIYSHLRRFHELDYEQLGCTNEVADSWRFTNASYWTALTTWFTGTASQSDPWGGSTATLFTATASVTNFVYASGANVVVNNDDVVFSVFAHRGTMGTDENTAIRILDTSDNAFAQVRINWLSTPTVTGSGALDTTVGITSLGGDWYQAWVYMDLAGTGRTGNTFSPRYSPMESGGDSGDTVYIAGVQLEYGVTTPCGTYVQKP